MVSRSEELTRAWIPKKGLLIEHRPNPSRFSLSVCLSLALALIAGFIGGFATAGLSIRDNYSLAYQNLLSELEASQHNLEQERIYLKNLYAYRLAEQNPPRVSTASFKAIAHHNQIHEQAIFSVFNHAVNLFLENNKTGACAELNNILNIGEYRGEWRTKAKYLLGANCN